MFTLILPIGGIRLFGTGALRKIESQLHEYCDGGTEDRDPDCCEQHRSFNAAIDGVESLILAHSFSGIDVSSEEYVDGIQTALDAVAHHLSD